MLGKGTGLGPWSKEVGGRCAAGSQKRQLDYWRRISQEGKSYRSAKKLTPMRGRGKKWAPRRALKAE